MRQGDARKFRVRTKVQAVITSPPYWRQKRYGDNPAEIGTGTLAQYIEDMVTVARRVWDALDDEGVFWLNIGDGRSGSGGAGGDHNKGGKYEHKPKYRGSGNLSGLAPRQSIDVPGRVLHALQDDGWLLACPIVWDKGAMHHGDYNFKRTRRPGITTEMIYMLVKQPVYRFYGESVFGLHLIEDRGNVWRFRPVRDSRASYAPFPDELVRRCVLLSTAIGHRVADPFSGSGTTGAVARAMGRKAIEVDLYA